MGNRGTGTQHTLAEEKLLVAILALVNFTHVLDFVIMMPLGPQLMRVFALNAKEFSVVVSSYTFAAAATGILSAAVLDKWDRKHALLTAYAGFTIGTGLCAMAPTFFLLLMARIVAGAFGGVVVALVFSILADAIPFERRGAATGTVMSAFSVASIVGLPLGLFLAAHLSWHAPFVGLAAISAIVWVFAWKKLPSFTSHLHGPEKHFVKEMQSILSNHNHWRAFAVSVLLMFGGFTVIPFISPYMVKNTGMTEGQLPLIYLTGGIFTFFTSRFIGRLADRYGKMKIFAWVSVISVVPILLLTNLPRIPIPFILATTTLFMVFVSGRFVPAMALMTASAKPSQRGGFMSLNGSIQNGAAGCASLVAGMIIRAPASGELQFYNRVGWVAAITTLLALVVARGLKSHEAA